MNYFSRSNCSVAEWFTEQSMWCSVQQRATCSVHRMRALRTVGQASEFSINIHISANVHVTRFTRYGAPLLQYSLLAIPIDEW